MIRSFIYKVVFNLKSKIISSFLIKQKGYQRLSSNIRSELYQVMSCMSGLSNDTENRSNSVRIKGFVEFEKNPV